jgi:enoyl-CoA hydratase/carnithine racemase
MLGSRLDADEALAAGLVTSVVSDSEDAMSQALQLAARLADQAPLAVRLIKQAVNEGLDGDLDRGLRLERTAVVTALLSDDSREGVAAFLAKRPPRFEGR